MVGEEVEDELGSNSEGKVSCYYRSSCWASVGDAV